MQCSGRSSFEAPDGDLHLATGRALLFPPLSAHNERVSGADFANLVLTIRDGRFGYHLTIEHPERRGSLRILRPDVFPCDPFGEACLAALARQTAPGRLRDALAGAFCAWAVEAIATAPVVADGGSERVRQVRELVAARLGSPELSVAQLGMWLGCHPDHLARSFRREVGETLIGHIQRVRLERARDLLADPRLSVREVARLVGFADPAYFSRIWRRHHGGPPGSGRMRPAGRVPA